MKKTVGSLLCIAAVLCIVLGIYQICSPTYKADKEEYLEWSQIYEDARLQVGAFGFYDLKQNMADLASDAYKFASEAKSEIDEAHIRCGILLVLGVACGISGCIFVKSEK